MNLQNIIIKNILQNTETYTVVVTKNYGYGGSKKNEIEVKGVTFTLNDAKNLQAHTYFEEYEDMFKEYIMIYNYLKIHPQWHQTFGKYVKRNDYDKYATIYWNKMDWNTRHLFLESMMDSHWFACDAKWFTKRNKSYKIKCLIKKSKCFISE